MMEHIVQFAISFDDETIKRRLENNAYDDIVDRIYDTIKSPIECRMNPIYRDSVFDKALESAVLKVVESHKYEIIERVSTRLTNRLIREQKNERK